MNEKLIFSQLETLRTLRSAIILLWKTDKINFIFSFITISLQGILPPIIAYLTKLIIDFITIKKEFSSLLWFLIGLECVTILFSGILSKISDQQRVVISEKIQKKLRLDVMRHSMSLDLEFFEQPVNYDILSKAQRELGYRPVLLVFNLLGFTQGIISFFGFSIVVFVINKYILILMIISAFPAIYISRKLSLNAFKFYSEIAPEGRRVAYFEQISVEQSYAKELRLFGLQKWILSRVNVNLDTMIRKRLNLEKSKAIYEGISEAFSTIVHYLSLSYFAFLAAKNIISIGTFMLAIGSISAIRSNIATLVSQFGDLLENSLMFTDLERFFAFRSNLRRPPNSGMELPDTVRTEIKLEQLHFTYPGSSTPIFSGLDLTINADQATALVGVNGAGKTTLVKLITRLYDPTAGRITLNSTDIREFDLEGYRKMFAVLLQDFAQYQMSARDNITLAQDDSNTIQVEIQNPSSLEQTAIKAGALELIQGLPNGWDTLLGRLFDEQGQDLSGGQWQRIALARALYRQAPILILDEPSAALDAEAEAELFGRYREFAKGKLSLLITHRFNTVRFADRIIVLEQGRVVEDGSHAELMRLRGRYFEMFSAQASAYEIPA
jgi:ATP-binding cassette, subfamily B, bacterial